MTEVVLTLNRGNLHAKRTLSDAEVDAAPGFLTRVYEELTDRLDDMEFPRLIDAGIESYLRTHMNRPTHLILGEKDHARLRRSGSAVQWYTSNINPLCVSYKGLTVLVDPSTDARRRVVFIPEA